MTVRITAPAEIAQDVDTRQPSDFGGDPPLGGLETGLAVADPFRACSPVNPAGVAGKILVLSRGSCFFHVKMMEAMAAGAVGAIVIGYDEVLVVMSFSQNAGNRSIPMAFVTKSMGNILLEHANNATVSFAVGQAKPSDKQILLDLFHATNGPSWRYPSYSSLLANWAKTADPCRDGRWEGVGCNENGDVTQLTLWASGLTGSLPSTLGNLASLLHLEIFSNDVSGTIPPMAFPSAVSLAISNGLLTGTLPHVFGDPDKLELVSFSVNQLSGTLPAWTQQLKNIVTIDFSGNSLSGDGASLLHALPPSAKTVKLGGSSLSGVLSLTGHLPNLAEVDLRLNRFSGFQAVNVTNLRILDLRENALPAFPRLDNCPSIQTLSLQGNQMTGHMPQEWIPPNVVTFDVSNNKLTGPLPRFPITVDDLILSRNAIDVECASLFQMAMWTISPGNNVGGGPRKLIADHNLITDNCGDIQLHNVPKLSVIDISHNRLSGRFVEVDLHNSFVEVVKLNNNNYTGEMRALESSIPFLRVLDLSANPLRSIDGQVPPGTVLGDRHVTFNVQDPFLCRPITALAPGLQVLLDPSYNNYQGCMCQRGLYGTPPHQCLPPPEQVQVYSATGNITDGNVLARLRGGQDSKWLVVSPHNDTKGCVISFSHFDLAERDQIDVYAGSDIGAPRVAQLRGPGSSVRDAVMVVSEDGSISGVGGVGAGMVLRSDHATRPRNPGAPLPEPILVLGSQFLLHYQTTDMEGGQHFIAQFQAISTCPEGYQSVADHCEKIQPPVVCQPGTAHSGPHLCVPCVSGHHAPHSDMQECIKCPQGSYSDTTGMTMCTSCALGTFQDREGQDHCLNCGIDHYADVNGSVVCKSCPPDTKNFLPHLIAEFAEGGLIGNYRPHTVELCHPLPGFYGPAGKQPTHCPLGSYCCSCPTVPASNCGPTHPMPGGIVLEPNCDLALLLENIDTLDRPCQQCQLGTPVPMTAQGFYNIRRDQGERQVIACSPPHGCAGGHLDSCRPGYEGKRCGACSTDYVRDAHGHCRACAVSQSWLIVGLVLLPLLCGALVVYTSADIFRFSFVPIGLDWAQSLLLVRSFDIVKPEEVVPIFDASATFSFSVDILPLKCLFEAAGTQWTFYNQWVLSHFVIIALPICCLVIFLLIAVLKVARVITGKHVLDQNTFVNCGCTCAAFLYTVLLINTLDVFRCVNPRNDTGMSFLVDAPDIQCFVGEWKHYAAAGVLLGLLYGIGIPLFLFFLLRRSVQTRMPTHIRTLRYGSLCAVYKEKDCYWNIVLMFKRFGLQVCLVVFPDSPLVQLALALMVGITYLVLTGTRRPFKFSMANSVSWWCAWQAIVTVLAAMIFHVGGLNATGLGRRTLVFASACVWASAAWCLFLLTRSLLNEAVSYWGDEEADQSLYSCIKRPLLRWYFRGVVPWHWAQEHARTEKFFRLPMSLCREHLATPGSPSVDQALLHDTLKDLTNEEILNSLLVESQREVASMFILHGGDEAKQCMQGLRSLLQFRRSLTIFETVDALMPRQRRWLQRLSLSSRGASSFDVAGRSPHELNLERLNNSSASISDSREASNSSHRLACASEPPMFFLRSLRGKNKDASASAPCTYHRSPIPSPPSISTDMQTTAATVPAHHDDVEAGGHKALDLLPPIESVASCDQLIPHSAVPVPCPELPPTPPAASPPAAPSSLSGPTSPASGPVEQQPTAVEAASPASLSAPPPTAALPAASHGALQALQAAPLAAAPAARKPPPASTPHRRVKMSSNPLRGRPLDAFEGSAEDAADSVTLVSSALPLRVSPPSQSTGTGPLEVWDQPRFTNGDSPGTGSPWIVNVESSEPGNSNSNSQHNIEESSDSQAPRRYFSNPADMGQLSPPKEPVLPQTLPHVAVSPSQSASEDGQLASYVKPPARFHRSERTDRNRDARARDRPDRSDRARDARDSRDREESRERPSDRSSDRRRKGRGESSERARAKGREPRDGKTREWRDKSLDSSREARRDKREREKKRSSRVASAAASDAPLNVNGNAKGNGEVHANGNGNGADARVVPAPSGAEILFM